MELLAAIRWNVDPEIFSIGFIDIRWYSLLFAAAFITGYYILAWIFKIENKSQKDLDSLTLYLMFATVIGARLGHCLFYDPVRYLSDPVEILKIWEGGLASHGAGFGILIGLWLYSRRRQNISYIWIMDRVAIVVAVAAIFVRLGNFFNSEIVGLPTDLPWAVIFENDTTHTVVPRHPTQIYEALAYLIVFFILLTTYKKYKTELPTGLMTGKLLTLLFSARFLIEFLKENQSGFEENLMFDMGQYLSLPFIAVGIYFWVRSYKFRQKE